MQSFPIRRRILVFAALAVAAAPALAQQNPLARGTWGLVSDAPIQGVWNGSDLERRSNCTSTQNDGDRGTYAEFDVTSDAPNHVLDIHQTGITGLECSYFGTYSGLGITLAWSGTYSCTDGKHGSFTSREIRVTQNSLTVHLDVKLDTTETCTIEKVIAAGRLYP